MTRALEVVCCISLLISIFVEGKGAVESPSFQLNEKDIHIYYYSQKLPNGKEILHQNYQEDMSQTNFDNTKKTFFAVHGWHNNFTSKFCEGLTETYLAKYDVNIFLLDWREIAKQPYPLAFLATNDIADTLGKLIKALIQYHGLELSNSVIVGHSLGAQIAGATGAALNGEVDTIIGLDPAGPGFIPQITWNRLDKTHAKFVMAVHTCPGFYGEDYPLGHADYYANNGIFQPGCPNDIQDGLLCAHTRSYYYFIESIAGGQFKSIKCKNYSTYKSGACANNSVSYMGQFDIDKSASGSYFFETNASPPYAKS